MYEVKLKGNYNLPVNDLEISFSPEQNVKYISDSDFNNSSDIKRFLNKYLTAKHIDDKQAVDKIVQSKKTNISKVDIIEIPQQVEEPKEPIIADGASKRSMDLNELNNKISEIAPVDVNDDNTTVVKADGASKNNVLETKVVEAKTIEEPVKVESVKVSEEPIKIDESVTFTSETDEQVKAEQSRAARSLKKNPKSTRDKKKQ